MRNEAVRAMSAEARSTHEFATWIGRTRTIQRPAFVDRPLHLRGRPERDRVRLWASDDEGRLTMSALAEIEA
jgi:hypothetical protein